MGAALFILPPGKYKIELLLAIYSLKERAVREAGVSQ